MEVQEYSVREFEKQIESLLSGILLILGSVPYPLATPMILDLAQETVLLELEACGKIRKDGDSWSYPWEARISDLFPSNREDIFTVEAICKRVSIPPASIEKLRNILEEMRQIS